MKKGSNIYQKMARRYHYMIVDISEGDETGYKAVIPKFPRIYIFADTPEELPALVRETVADELEYCQKNNFPIPRPDVGPSSFSGKFVLRIDPTVHERLTYLSQAEGKTLNQYIKEILQSRVGETAPL